MTFEKKNQIKAAIKAAQQDYVGTQITKIWELIRQNSIAGEDYFWYSFFWDDGDYTKVVEYFENIGITFGSPTSPWDGGSTSFSVNIKSMNEIAEL